MTWSEIRRLRYLPALVFVLVTLCANKACRENYYFATQSDLSKIGGTETPGTRTATPTGSVTTSPTPTETPDAGTTGSPTVTPTQSGVTGTPTRTPRGTATNAKTATAKAELGLSILKGLEDAVSSSSASSVESAASAVAPQAVAGGASADPLKTSNWLGNLYGNGAAQQRVLYIANSSLKAPLAREQATRVLRGSSLATRSANTENLAPELLLDPDIVIAENGADSEVFCATLSSVRAAPRRATSPRQVIVVTADSASPLPACVRAAASEVVGTPVSRKALKTALDRALQRIEGSVSETTSAAR